MPDSYHLTLLTETFDARRKKNPRYSLRAFAAHLGMHPSALSRVLAKKQLLSSKNSIAIVKKLEFGKEEQRLFLQSVALAAYRHECAKLGEKVGADGLACSPKPIPNEVYSAVATLACLSIVQLTFTHDFRSEPAWMAERLGLTESEVENCVKALLEAGLLVRNGDRLVGTDARLTAIDPAETSRIRRDLQKQILRCAGESLERDPLPVRGHYGMTMAIDPSKIAEANRMISDFVESLCDFLGTGKTSEVYQLGVQLYPLSVLRQGKEK